MKTIVRIVTLALALGLAGALTTAWGAESVVNLISKGETSIAAVNSSKAALDAATQKSNALATEGNQIRADQQQLQADIAAYQKQNDDLKQQTTDYKSKCSGKQLTPDQYKACKAQLAQINEAISAVNAQPAKLKARQSAFVQRATKYNQEVQTAPKGVRAADNKYRNAVATQESWLDQSRDLVASPAFQPYAKKAGCPNVMKPPKTYAGIISMSGSILSCLKKVAGN